MKSQIVWTLLVCAEMFHIAFALQNCNELDPLVDTTPSWQTITSGGSSELKYCAPQLPQTYYDSCEHALGLQSRFIPDEQMSASSAKDNNPDVYGGAYGRVADARTLGTGWVAGIADTNQWLLIDTAQLSIVTMVATQSRGWRGDNSWVKAFTLEHSLDNVTYTTYTEREESSSCTSTCDDPHEFDANTQGYLVVDIPIASPFLARYVRFKVVRWKSADIAMRAELYGCRYSIAANATMISNANLDGNWYYNTTGGTSIKYQVTTLDSAIILEDPLGMEDSSIADGDITASSTQAGSSAAAARLNQAGGWTADTADTNQYLLIDLTGNRYISMIDVQGASTNSYTETYYISSSLDGLTYTDYEFNDAQKEFTGNSGDGDTVVREYLMYPLFCRFIKISPQTYTGSKPSLRVELYGKTIQASDCDFWYQAGKTTGAFYLIAVTSNPVTYDGVYCSFSNAYTSCLDYKSAGHTVDGYYWIYAGGVGNGFPVYCYFSTVMNGAYTEILHDRTGDVLLDRNTLSSPYSAGQNAHTITYSNGVDVSEIASVISGEDFCYQSLYYKSTNAKIWDNNVQNVWWESVNDEQMLYWPGADPTGASGCRCGQLGNCVDANEKCNSDADTTQELTDGGYITDSSKLPVKTLKLGGYTNTNSAYYNLGKLECMSSSATLPTSCLAAQAAGYSTSGFYLIDPDGSGGPLIPLLVICDFSSVKNAVVMEIAHHYEEENEIVQYNEGGSFAKDIVYYGTYEAMATLIASSTACTQYLGFRCSGSQIQSSGTQNTWWASADGTTMDHWSGTSEAGKCACGATGSCYDNSLDCNCEDNSQKTKEDKGYITDPSKLPVSQIRSGDTDSSSKSAFITLGRLTCYERVGSEIQTCYDAKQGGATDDGYYLLDADGSGSANAFIAECGLNVNSTHALTIFNHDSEARTHVAGYGPKGSFIQSVLYEHMDVAQLEAQFLLPSTDYYQTCSQYIKYECYDAKLLKSGAAWWVSFSGETKSYWGGANGQEDYCACGLNNTCHASGKKCNCDAEVATWLEDDGYLIDFRDEVLPVVQLRFGDTSGGAGSEEGYFTLGKLECHISARAE